MTGTCDEARPRLWAGEVATLEGFDETSTVYSKLAVVSSELIEVQRGGGERGKGYVKSCASLTSSVGSGDINTPHYVKEDLFSLVDMQSRGCLTFSRRSSSEIHKVFYRSLGIFNVGCPCAGMGARGSLNGATHVSFAADGMLAAVFRVALKAFGERARYLTLPGPGFRQVQLDADFLRQVGPKLFPMFLRIAVE